MIQTKKVFIITVGFWCQTIHKQILWRFDTNFGLKMMVKSGLEFLFMYFKLLCAPPELLLTGLVESAFLADFLAIGTFHYLFKAKQILRVLA